MLGLSFSPCSQEVICVAQLLSQESHRGRIVMIDGLFIYLFWCVCVLSALALAVRPRMDVEEAACIWLFNHRLKKTKDITGWIHMEQVPSLLSLAGVQPMALSDTQQLLWNHSDCKGNFQLLANSSCAAVAEVTCEQLHSLVQEMQSHDRNHLMSTGP